MMLEAESEAAPANHVPALVAFYGADYRRRLDERVREQVFGAERLLIFGAGQNGRMVLRQLRAAGVEPEAFLDDTPGKIGQSVEGTPVLPVSAARQMSGAVVIVAIFTPAADYLSIALRLRRMGVRPTPLFAVLWAFGADDLPFYFLDDPQTVVNAVGDLTWLSTRLLDVPSRALLQAQVKFRLSLRYEVLPPWAARREGPPENWPRFHIIDAGAYDGDTLSPMLSAYEGRVLSAVAIEPDAGTYHRLRENLARTQTLSGPPKLIRGAVDAVTGVRTFASAGHQGSQFAEAGTPVETFALDEIVDRTCPGAAPIYVKFDVEGAEGAALAGARETIARRRPFMSIAAYHRPQDLWALARQISEIEDGYGFLLRSHGADGADLNLYAVPPS